MSFILDALKKSESDRQRQTGPALFEVKIAPPKARFPPWAIAIAVLLGVNMVIVGWLLLRRFHSDDTASVGSVGTPAGMASYPPGGAPAGGSSTAGPAGAGSSPTGITGVGSAGTGSQPGVSGVGPPQVSGAPVDGGTNMSQQTQQSTAPTTDMRGDLNAREPTLAAARQNSTATNNVNPPAGTNPDDYAPAADPTSSSPFKGHVRRGTESGLSLYQDAALAPGSNLPNLRLDLHVYAVKPEDRFALINMRKLHEGDTVQDVRVESITPDGVIMSHNGSKFLLPRD
jgi:general secretion pathway protein B